MFSEKLMASNRKQQCDKDLISHNELFRNITFHLVFKGRISQFFYLEANHTVFNQN